MTRLPDEILVFDVGGTHLRAGIYETETGELTSIRRRSTPSLHTLGDADAGTIRRALYDAMEAMARELVEGRVTPAVAVAFPGPVDPRGAVLGAPTVWGPTDPARPVPVARELARRWPGSRLLLLNDMTAAGYRYVEAGGPDVCVFTVSSGIGHKIFVDGRPLIGIGGRGGELGHLRVDFSPDAPRCECGGQGHLGAVASGRATAYHARALIAADPEGFAGSLPARRSGSSNEIDNAVIAEAFRAGDAWTLRLVDRLAEPLGRALAAVHVATGVERFVILGGFALALGPAYRERVRDSAATSAWDLGQDWDRMVELGSEDEEACLIGAGRYAVRELQQDETRLA